MTMEMSEKIDIPLDKELRRYEVLQEISRMLEANPRTTLKEMSNEIDMPISTIHTYLKRIFEKYELKGTIVLRKSGDVEDHECKSDRRVS